MIDKALIDQHTRDIEELKNKPPIEIPDIPAGSDLDMAQLMNIFAAKTPPDNTINRIEALEKKVHDLLNREPPAPQIIHQTVQNIKNVSEEAPVQAAPVPAAPVLDQDALDKIEDLLRRVQGLETRADKTDRHQDQQDETLTDHERRIKALEAMDLSASVPVSGDVDTAAILKQVNIVKAEVSQVRSESLTFKEKTINDLEALRLELRGYTDKEVGDASKKLTKKITDLTD